MNSDILLEVKKLRKYFHRTKGFSKRVVGIVKAVDEIDFFIRSSETLGLVGESGCGKTTTGLCILRAHEPTSGEIRFRKDEGQDTVDLVKIDRSELKEVMKNMGMIFQDPYSSLNPRITILETVAEPLVIHGVAPKAQELKDKVAGLLKMVHLDPTYMARYPHAFSGGQRQRIAIARALALMPKFIVADEPISALDVSVQAQILELLNELKHKFHFTYLFIAHNLAVVEYFSDRVAVMYVGKIVELANTTELFSSPHHPYTEALLSAVPKPDPRSRKNRILLRGDIADPANPPQGCYFHPRCRYAQQICREHMPPLLPANEVINGSHYTACHFTDILTLVGV